MTLGVADDLTRVVDDSVVNGSKDEFIWLDARLKTCQYFGVVKYRQWSVYQ